MDKPVSGFGRFDWNISQEISTALNKFTKWMNMFGAFSELFVIVFFFVKFCQKKSVFTESFFVIYTIGCIVDAAPKFLVFYNTYFGTNVVSGYLYFFFLWYNSNFMNLWNFFLALNRFTAIFYSLDFNIIWSKRNTTIVCIFLCFYPFLVHIHNPVYMWCQMIGNNCPRSLLISESETIFESYFVFISEITYSATGTILCCAAAYRIIRKKLMKNQNVEVVLLIQSLTSSVFLILSTTTSWLASVNGALADPAIPLLETLRAIKLQTFLTALSNFFYNIHHYIAMILLICFSRTVRTGFFAFYRIDKLLDRIRKPKNKIRTVQVQPAGTKTMEPTQRSSHVKITTHR